MGGWVGWLTFAAALGTAAVTGVFFVFSAFAMRSLGRLPAAQGVTAMQTINVDVQRPPFLLPFLGTTVASAVLVVQGVLGLDVLLVGGAVAYLVGPLGVTMLYNVPRNDALDRVDPPTAGAREYWQRYQREWQAANHVRTLTGLLALGLLIAALQAA
jgi:uncharacterized membrane protein